MGMEQNLTSGVVELTVVFFFFDTAFPWKRKKKEHRESVELLIDIRLASKQEKCQLLKWFSTLEQ